jgi:hypothetical protein
MYAQKNLDRRAGRFNGIPANLPAKIHGRLTSNRPKPSQKGRDHP